MVNLEQILIQPDVSIRGAIEAKNRSPVGIVLLMDEDIRYECE